MGRASDISLFLNSRTSTRILELLSAGSGWLSTRVIADIIETNSKTTQVTLKQLTNSKVLKSKSVGQEVVYAFNRQNVMARVLQEMFEAMREAKLTSRWEDLSKSLELTLSFNDEARSFFNKARF